MASSCRPSSDFARLREPTPRCVGMTACRGHAHFRLRRDGPELGIGPEPANADHDAEDHEHSAVGCSFETSGISCTW